MNHTTPDYIHINKNLVESITLDDLEIDEEQFLAACRTSMLTLDVSFTDRELLFAYRVYYLKEDVREAYTNVGLHLIYDTSEFSRDKIGKKQAPSTIRTNAYKLRRKLRPLIVQIRTILVKPVQTGVVYSKDVALQGCLSNIQICRTSIASLTDMQETLRNEKSKSVVGLGIVSDLILKNQKVMLLYIKELNKLENLYKRESLGELERVNIIYENDVER